MSSTPTPNSRQIPNAGWTREQLYERLRSESKDALVLSEMQRLGFWPLREGQPDVAADLLQRESALMQQLDGLRTQLGQVSDRETALRELRRERMAQARARREETLLRRNQQRQARALDWRERQSKNITYLGAGVSSPLYKTGAGESARPLLPGLPVLKDALALATALGITLGELRFLGWNRVMSRISHYQRFAIPKKRGGERVISAPMPRLKRAQYWVLDNILARVALHPAAHGFVPGRSILSTALPHVGRPVVVNLDLKDFFPSIALPRVHGVFAQLGYCDNVARILALLCTELPAQQVQIDGQTLFVADGKRVLPQGAPTSPALTNVLCRRMDARLHGSAQKLGFDYTRYADDLTFSAKDAAAAKTVGKLLWRVKQIIASEGFTVHPEKQEVMRPHQQQRVTGIVVNQRPSLDRKTLHRFRAVVQQVERNGPAGLHWGGNPLVVDALIGYARYWVMVDAKRASPWLQRAQALRQPMPLAPDQAPRSTTRRLAPAGDFRQLAAAGQAPWANWWQPAAKPEPVLEKTSAEVAKDKTAKKNVQPRADIASASTPSQHPIADVPEPSIRTKVLLWQVVASLLASVFAHSIFPFVVGSVLIFYCVTKRRENIALFVVGLLFSVIWGR